QPPGRGCRRRTVSWAVRSRGGRRVRGRRNARVPVTRGHVPRGLPVLRSHRGPGGCCRDPVPASSTTGANRPRRIILVRHGESEGNIDDTIYETVPDHALSLTPKGLEQVTATGRRLVAYRKDET